jgi:hypothetical protein
MIAVLSYDVFEQGTEGVIEWLAYLKADFVKIRMKDFYLSENEIELDVCSDRLRFNGKDITDRVNVIFYRRLFEQFKLNDTIQNPFSAQLEDTAFREAGTLVNDLFRMFSNKVWLPKSSSAHLSKLAQIRLALLTGLSVPKTKVINNKKMLKKFISECPYGIITKPLTGLQHFVVSKYSYTTFVSSVTEESIDELPDFFFPSFFQERIEKDYEIRVFYLDGVFCNLALLVSNVEQPVDIKQSKEFEHMHWVPYKLPDSIEKKLNDFMKRASLNTGSMDIIKTRNGDHVFLEVNPVGQYGHGSHFGNFQLEKMIAQWLIQKDQ